MKIIKRRVFISYYHKENQKQKDHLIKLFNNSLNCYAFNDCSVHQQEINDEGLTAKQIRNVIRKQYIYNADVVIVLCGENTKGRKHVDWEIHAAMINNPTGILVINMPSIYNKQFVHIGLKEDNSHYTSENIEGINENITKEDIDNCFQYLPNRIALNIIKNNVRINILDWTMIQNDPERLMYFIERAFRDRKFNKYDTSTPLKVDNTRTKK